jgi:hypothetical protein
LAKAADPHQLKAVGNQSGGRVFLFLETEDFRASYEAMQAKGGGSARRRGKSPTRPS